MPEPHRHEFEYRVKGTAYSCIAMEADAFFGKGIRIEVFEHDGRLRDRLRFNCHPEFVDYQEFQAKSHEALARIAVDRLKTGKYERVLGEARPHGLELLMRFNGETDAYEPGKYPA